MKTLNFKRSLVSFAVAAASASFLAACGDGEAASTDNQDVTQVPGAEPTAPAVDPTIIVEPVITVEEQVTFKEVNAPKATISGVVLDTNNQPVAGATVTVLGESVVTGADGSYVLSNVAVTGTYGASSNQELANASLTVRIDAPSDYLDGLVTVKPFAQLIAPDNQAPSLDTISAAEIAALLDGYAAEAGTAFLPKSGATIKGVLWDAEGDHVVPNAKIAVDVLSVALTPEQAEIAGTGAQIQTPTYNADENGQLVTDENGVFEVRNLPLDANLALLVESYTFGVLTSKALETSAESVLDLGEVIVTKVSSGEDTVSPFVKKVHEVAHDFGDFGRLSDDVGTVLTLEFSEPVYGVDGNSVIARYKKDGVFNKLQVSNVAVDPEDPTLVTVTFGQSLNGLDLNASEIHLNLLSQDFKDNAASGNPLVAGETVSIGVDGNGDPITQFNNFGISFDQELSGGENTFVRMVLRPHADPALDLAATELEQNGQTTNANKDFAVIQAANSAFADVVTDQDGIQQLNNADVDGNGDNLAAKRLDALLSVQADTLGLDDELRTGVSVDSDVARITVSPKDGESGALGNIFQVRVLAPSGLDESGEVVGWNPQNVGGSTSDIAVSGVATQSVVNETVRSVPETAGSYAVVTLDAPAASFDLLLAGVAPGYKVVITSLDDLLYEAAISEVVLTDNVAPTVALQNSYDSNESVDSTDYADTSELAITYGDAGELSDIGNPVVGYPVLGLTPRLLARVDGKASGPDGTDYINKLTSLYELNYVNGGDTSSAGVINGEAFIKPEDGIYDENAIAVLGSAAGAISSNVGVSLTEDVSLVADPAVENVTTSVLPDFFSAWDVANNVTSTDVGAEVEADLAIFTVDDIYGFTKNVGVESQALKADGAATGYPLISFVGALEDSVGNQASAAAKVALQDRMPPLVTSAQLIETSGQSQFVIEFDKPVQIPADATLTVGSLVLTLENEETHELSSDGKELRIFQKAWNTPDSINIESVFGLGGFVKDGTAGLAKEATNIVGQRGKLGFSAIENLEGYSWAYYEAKTGSDKVEAPYFAIVNAIPKFSVTSESATLTPGVAAGANATGKAGTLVIEVAFSHKLNESVYKDLFAAVKDNVNSVGQLTVESAVYSNETLTITVKENSGAFGTLTSAMTVELNTLVSNYDATQTVVLQGNNAIDIKLAP